MADIVDARTRSRMMSKINGSNTRPEKAVRSALHRHGLRFRLYRKDLPGKPDIVLPAASKDSGSQPLGEAKQNPKQSMPDIPRNAAQQKSQTPLITAFGFECLGLSGPLIAAEGLEPPTRGL